MKIESLRSYGLTALLAACVLLGFSAPISVALDNVLLAILLLGAIFNLRAIAQIAMENPLARAATLLFAALFAAMFYGAATPAEATGALGKYVDLLFIPVFIWILRNEAARRAARTAFLVAMWLTLLLSYLVGFKLLPIQYWMTASALIDNPVVFHSYLAQNNMMALAVFLVLLNFRESVSSRTRLIWGAFIVLAVYNVLFMMQGRTGYLILLVLISWFFWATLVRYMQRRGRLWGARQAGAFLMVALTIVVIVYQASPRLHERIGLLGTEYQAWQPNQGKETSTGQRLDFYYNSLKIVQEQPLLGVGTGGFPAAFAKQIQGTDALKTVNPHNEFLLITMQAGMGGLALLLYLFYTHWRCAAQLGSSLEQDAARGLLLMYVINCAVNSALYDHVDGLLFAYMTATFFAGYKTFKHD